LLPLPPVSFNVSRKDSAARQLIAYQCVAMVSATGGTASGTATATVNLTLASLVSSLFLFAASPIAADSLTSGIGVFGNPTKIFDERPRANRSIAPLLVLFGAPGAGGFLLYYLTSKQEKKAKEDKRDKEDKEEADKTRDEFINRPNL